MSVRTFAAHLSVSDRMVSKWEAGGEAIEPRPENQAALDMSLASASRDVRARFERLVNGAVVSAVTDLGTATQMLARHPIDEQVMVYIRPGPFEGQWLPGFFIDRVPVSNGAYATFVHLTGHRPPALWPDGTCPDYLRDRPVEVPWSDAEAYCQWASKGLPSEMQLRRALHADEGVVFRIGSEWMSTAAGPRRFQTGDQQGNDLMRTATDAAVMLGLLLP